MDWLHYLVEVWSGRLVVWSGIFIAGSVSKYLEVEEDYQQVGGVAKMILLDLGY